MAYFFLGHPVYCVGWGVKLYSLTHSPGELTARPKLHAVEMGLEDPSSK